MEYGYSCMGYEIAAGMGAKMALPERDIVVLLDNRGFKCINRLQGATDGRSVNNFLDSAPNLVRPSDIDFTAHAGAQGGIAEKVADIAALEEAIAQMSV